MRKGDSRGGHVAGVTTKEPRALKADSTRPSVPTVPETPKVNKARRLNFPVGPETTIDRVAAEMALGPLVGNMSTALDYSTGLMGELVLQECVEVMAADVQAVNDGDLSKLEGMLTAQAHALDAMFNHYAKKAIHNAAYLPQLEAYARLAMKAQSQCRTTVEAIAEIKMPKSAMFIKQANIAQQQQVNNGRPGEAEAEPRAREKDVTPSKKLLTEEMHAPLDTGRAGEAVHANSKLEAVGALDRAAH